MKKENGHIAILFMLLLSWLSMDILGQYRQLYFFTKHLEEYHKDAHTLQP